MRTHLLGTALWLLHRQSASRLAEVNARTLYRRGSRLITGLHGPNRLCTEIDDIPVQIVVETNYPFGEKLVYRLEVGAPVRFELWLRIPGWCDHPRIETSFAEQPTMTKRVPPPSSGLETG